MRSRLRLPKRLPSKLIRLFRNSTNHHTLNKDKHMKSIRRGTVVAKVLKDDHGREYSATVTDHKTLNAAKRANGPNATTGRTFPPQIDDLPKIEEAAAA